MVSPQCKSHQISRDNRYTPHGSCRCAALSTRPVDFDMIVDRLLWTPGAQVSQHIVVSWSGCCCLQNNHRSSQRGGPESVTKQTTTASFTCALVSWFWLYVGYWVYMKHKKPGCLYTCIHHDSIQVSDHPPAGASWFLTISPTMKCWLIISTYCMKMYFGIIVVNLLYVLVKSQNVWSLKLV